MEIMLPLSDAMLSSVANDFSIVVQLLPEIHFGRTIFMAK